MRSFGERGGAGRGEVNERKSCLSKAYTDRNYFRRIRPNSLEWNRTRVLNLCIGRYYTALESPIDLIC